MKQIKKCICLLLILCIALPACGFAANGDVVIARWGSKADIDDLIRWQFARDDELVLVGEEALYTWREGEDLHAYAWQDNRLSSLEIRDGEMKRSYVRGLAAFTDGEEIYVVLPAGRAGYPQDESEDALLFRAVLEGDTARLEEAGLLNWECLGEDGDAQQELYDCTYVDGTLYGYQWNAYEGVYSIPVDGSRSQRLDLDGNPAAICAYRDGKVLLLIRDRIDAQTMRVLSWDPQEEDAEELCVLKMDNYCRAACYDAQEDRALFLYGNALYGLHPETGDVEELCNLSAFSGSMTTMLPGGYCAISNSTATVAKDTTSISQETAHLSVHINWSNLYLGMSSAVLDFSLGHSNAVVDVQRGWTRPDQLIEDMLTRSVEDDIYVGRLSTAEFDTVFSRGYMAELQGSDVIDHFIAELYPNIAETLCPNGVPVAIPLDTVSSCFGVNLQALEEAGLSLEDIPTNWQDFLDALPAIAAKMDETGGQLLSYATSEDAVKGELLDQILDSYMLYRQYVDPQMRFCTEELLSILQKLEEMDLQALMPGGKWDPNDIFGEPEKALFRATFAAVPWYDGNRLPLCMAMTPDAPHLIPITIDVAFINPYSENKELAVEFLECMLNNLEPAEIAGLCDIDITPRREPGYERALELARQELENLLTEQAQAGEADAQRFEDSIRRAEERLAAVESGYWEFDAEYAMWYRAHADELLVKRYNILAGTEDDSEIGTLIAQYKHGQISAEEMLRGMDRKLEMMILEGN